MAYVLVYEGDALKEQRELTTARLTIGRATDNDVVLAASAVSGHHATIEKKGSSFVLTDNGSSNGVFVDGARVDRHPLKYWEEIRIANYLLKFRPRARLPGERDGELAMPDQEQEIAATAEIDVTAMREVVERRKLERRKQQRTQEQSARYLLADVADKAANYRLDKGALSIGKADNCDIRVRGWFAPGVAANVRRHSDGFYVFPERRGKTHVNGNRISQPTQLKNGDCLAVRNVVLVFSRIDPAG